MTEIQKIAAYINKSTTGAIATVMNDHVSVQVPGIGWTGGKSYRFYNTEKILSMSEAIRLVNSME